MDSLSCPCPSAPAPTLWLCLRFEQLALEALRTTDCSLDFVSQQQRLVAVSPRALTLGLHCGMSVSHALMIAPDSRGMERDPLREQQHLQVLAHWACRYTPQVSMGEHCLLLEVGASLRLFKGFRRLLQPIQQALAEFSVSARMGLAHTPAAAYVLSHVRNNGIAQGRDGALDPEIFLLLLGQVAIEYLAIDNNTVDQLQGCGFGVLEDLLVAPRAEIGQRFGRRLLDYLARLLGDKDDPQQIVLPVEPFLRVQDFSEPIHNSQWITQCTDDMLQQLCAFLQRRQWCCQMFVWRFYNNNKHSDKQPMQQLSIALSSKHHGFETFKQLTDLHLEKISLRGELMRIELFSDRLLPSQLFIEDFFDPGIKEREAAELVDKLAARFGRDVVSQLSDVAQQIPELSAAHSMFSTSSAPAQPAVLRQSEMLEFQPLWLLARPKKLAHQCDDPARPLDDQGRPMQLIQGPDRIDSHWWCSQQTTSLADKLSGVYCRDYFIARQRSGHLLWVFYDRLRLQWFLHGLFS